MQLAAKHTCRDREPPEPVLEPPELSEDAAGGGGSMGAVLKLQRAGAPAADLNLAALPAVGIRKRLACEQPGWFRRAAIRIAMAGGGPSGPSRAPLVTVLLRCSGGGGGDRLGFGRVRPSLDSRDLNGQAGSSTSTVAHEHNDGGGSGQTESGVI